MPEHIERANVPIIDGFLHPFSLFITLRDQLRCLVITIFDMTQFLGYDIRQNALEWQIAAVVKFFQLISPDPIDQEAKNGVVLPVCYETAKRVHETLLIGLAQHKRDV